MHVNNSTIFADTATKRKVFIVDDHPIVRQGLAHLIEAESDLTVAGEGENVYESLRAIRAAKPDLVLVDVSLKENEGVDLLKEIKSQMPALPVLVVSMHDESMVAERALRAGAGGYVMKQEEPTTLVQAMRTVLGGNVYVSPAMNATLLHRMVQGQKQSRELAMDRLTDRELEIFQLIGTGKSVREIAANLLLSVKTVEAHREHIKQKLNIRSSSELLRFALRHSANLV